MNPLDRNPAANSVPNETNNGQPFAHSAREGSSNYGVTFNLNPAGNHEAAHAIGKEKLLNQETDSQSNRSEEESSADPESGEGSWTLGISLMYDVDKKEEGAQEIIKSLHTSFPYRLKDIREVEPVVTAYLTLKDDKGLRDFLSRLDQQPQGNATAYAGLARILQEAGKNDLRDLVLTYGESVDSRTRAVFQNGAAANSGGTGTANVAAPTPRVTTNTAPGLIRR